MTHLTFIFNEKKNSTLLKMKVLYWHRWFHEERLTSNRTKGSFLVENGALDYSNVFKLRKKMVVLRNVQ